MTRAEIYRRAAQKVFCCRGRGEYAEWFSCNAISVVDSGIYYADCITRDFYIKMFKPENEEFDIGPWGDRFAVRNTDRQERRVLALCFAAAMADAGDL